MRILSIIVLFIAICFDCNAQGSQKFNLNFETQGSNTNLAEGWFKWGDYDLGLDSAITHNGTYAATITSDSAGDSFGSVAYQIPAGYDGKSIKLEGYMKIKNVQDGHAGLIMRVDGNGNSLAFDNMNGQNVTGTKEWQKYSITLQYPEGAEKIYVGGVLVGKGKAWFDDLELTIDGENVQTLKESEQRVFKADKDDAFDEGSMINFPELDENLVNNLTLLGKIWGFLKYHHPAIAEGNYNWDYELFRILPDYMNHESKAEQDQILIDWIDSYGNVPACDQCPEIASNAFLKPDLSWIDNNNLGSQLKNKLHYIYDNRHRDENFYVKLRPNVKNPIFQNEDSYSDMSYPDEGFRLLALYRYWNIIEYYFPYRHLTDKDWDKILKEYIPAFINAENELEYELAAVQLIGDVKDSHANLWSGGNKISELRGDFYPPFHTRFIEDKLVITDYYNPELKEKVGLEVGDIITRINGKAVEEIVDSVKTYYPASNPAVQNRDISADLLRSNQEEIAIGYASKEEEGEKDLRLYKSDSLNLYRWYPREEKKSYKLLDGNIGYITLQTIKKEDIARIKQEFIDTKGIIIDIRNYPSTFVPFLLGSYFVSSSVPFVKFTSGSVTNPGTFVFYKTLEIPQSSQTYPRPLVVIVNELSQSQAEYTAMAFRAGENTTIIGSTTAGADGNISSIPLPGGLNTAISGIGVYYPDGGQTQRIGIVPDITVEPTIEGIRKGKDELLNKAIEIINEHN